MVAPSTNNIYLIPNLAEFISRRMRDISARINCHTIGTVVSFNSTNQTVVVNVNFLRVNRAVNPIGTSGNSSDEVISIPIQLVDVPIIILQGGASALTFPVAAGDSCMLMFCDRDMDNWLHAGTVAVPNSERVHDINDAVALVGLRNFTNPLTNYNSNVASLYDRTGERLAQSGDLKATARSTAPSGWLLAYGQSLLRTDYPDLFTAIGTTYGSADGTHFNVPDLRGRVPVGLDNMGGSDANVLTNTYNPNRNTLGGAIGEEAHQLIVAELPAHHHPYAALTTPGAGDSGGAYDTPYTNNTGDTGNDVPHQNVQPGRMFNWLIKI